MFETMYGAPGIGLAAIQVGVAKRILVIDLQEPDPEDEEGKALIREPRVFINPVFSDESEEHSVYQDRKSVVKGKSGSVRVDLGGRRISKKKKTYTHQRR